MNKFKQFWINLWKAIKNFFLSFKVMNKEQYNSLINKLLENKDKAFDKLDINKDGIIQCSEIIDTIKDIFKKEKEHENNEVK